MTSPSRALRARTLGLLLLSVQPLCSLPVFAAGSSQHYSIDAGPLDAALSRFGAQAGITMAGSSTLTAGKNTQGLQGDFSTEAGLTQLLLGSGLTYQRQDDGSLLLVPSSSDVLELAPTAISGTAYDTSLGRNDGMVASRTMSANKTDTSIMETPQSISVVTRKQIDAQQPQSIGQVLRYTAGVNGEANGVDTRRDTISIRGFDATTGGGIYRDGLRQYSFANQSRAVGEVYGLERVEVLRGPSSVLYGQSSPGGMVNVISKRPTDEPLHELVVQAGSFDRKQLAADFGGPLSDDGVLSYRLTGLWRESGTQIDYARDDRQFIAPAISWRPSEDTSLTVLASFQKDRNVLGYYALPRVGTLDSSRYGRIATDRFVGDPDFDKYDVEQWSLGYQFEHHLNDIWTFRQNARYSRSYQEQRTIYQYGLDDDQRTVGRFGYLGHEEVKNALLDNHFQAQWNVGRFEHTTLVGIDLQHASTNQLGGRQRG